jgi:adenylate cyclase
VTVDEDAMEIDAYLKSLGATDEQVANARRQCHLAGLAGDLVFARGSTLTARDLASRSGISVDDVLAMWRTMGVAVPDAGRSMFSEDDAELTSFLVQANPVGVHGGELLRVLGSSLSRVAEAAVSVYVQTQEPPVDSPELDILAWAKEQVAVSAAALRLGDSMGSVFSHHMRDAIDRQRAAQAEVSDRSLYRLAVGFVDLVGFTPLSLHTSPTSLLELVGVFEDKAFEVASSHRGRIVKHIGDEVMFVAPDAGEGCAIAREITAAFGSGIEPRGGVCFGDVIARHGDYYGPVVNLASRLADLAIPGEVLVDGDTARSAAGTFEFREAGRRLLKGFDDPIEVHSVGRSLSG